MDTSVKTMSQTIADFQKRLSSSPINFGTTKWALYRKVDEKSETFSREAFLAVGPKNKFRCLPAKLPLSLEAYVFVGWFDLSTGEVTERFVMKLTSPDPKDEVILRTTNSQTEGWHMFCSAVEDTPHYRIDVSIDGKHRQTHYSVLPEPEGDGVEFMDEEGEDPEELKHTVG